VTTKRQRRQPSHRRSARPRGPVAEQRVVDELAERTLHRRAVEAAIWGMPIVSYDAMRQAFLRDAGAKYNDIVFWSSPADWQLQITTPNASAHYVFIAINLKEGPLVLEIPAAVGAGLFGSINDAWQTPLVDVGRRGVDEGKGGRYLVLPPGHSDDAPDGFIPIHMHTFGGYSLLRVIPDSSSHADLANALALVQRTSVYLLAQASDPPKQHYIDMSDRIFDGIVRFDESFFASLTRVINEEPVQPRDLVAMGQLRSLGIGRGKPFHPDELTRQVLDGALLEAHEIFKHGVTVGEPYWPGIQWMMPGSGIGPRTGFTFETDDGLAIDERAMVFFLACAPPKKIGTASVYLWAAYDERGELLDGGNTYRLRVPPDVPAEQFWAVTVYDLDTAGFIRESPRVELNSFDENVVVNGDGSVDVYFAPSALEAQRSNWVYTAPGKHWFAAFRFYGPLLPLTEKTWMLGDIELLS
jgi:hypothetical protein